MMMENDIKRNGSGYVDEPCYRAVTAPPRPGEIWIHGNSGAQMLVLANVKGICPTLRLTDTGCEGAVPIMSRTPMFVKPAMIGYCFENLLTTFVKTVKGNEMEAVRKGIIRALGLGKAAQEDDSLADEKNALEGVVEALKEENVVIRAHNDSLKKQLADAEKNAEAVRFDLDAKTMADKMVADAIAGMQEEITMLRIYKDMYMDIIGKLVSMRGGRCCQ